MFRVIRGAGSTVQNQVIAGLFLFQAQTATANRHVFDIFADQLHVPFTRFGAHRDQRGIENAFDGDDFGLRIGARFEVLSAVVDHQVGVGHA